MNLIFLSMMELMRYKSVSSFNLPSYHQKGDRKDQIVFYKCFMNRKQKPYMCYTEFDDRGITEIK